MPEARNSVNTACGFVLVAATFKICVERDQVALWICSVSVGDTVTTALAEEGLAASGPE